MPLFYITGISGSGKSTITSELKRLGYEAYDIDDMASWYNEVTGEFELDNWLDSVNRTGEFYKTYSWKVPREKVEAITKSDAGKTIFLSGSVANENELVELFDKVFALAIDDDTLRHRLLTRTNNNYGKNPAELRQSLEWNNGITDKYKSSGYIIMDATRSVDSVVNEIIAKISVEKRRKMASEQTERLNKIEARDE
jgi:dephospho-CoA kinase